MALQLYYKVENVTRQKKQDQDLLNLNVPFPRTNKYVTPTISHVATVAWCFGLSWHFSVFYGIFGRKRRKVNGHKCKNDIFTRTTVLIGIGALSGVVAKRRRRRKEEWKHPYFAFDGLNDGVEGRISQPEPAHLEA